MYNIVKIIAAASMILESAAFAVAHPHTGQDFYKLMEMPIEEFMTECATGKMPKQMNSTTFTLQAMQAVYKKQLIDLMSSVFLFHGKDIFENKSMIEENLNHAKLIELTGYNKEEDYIIGDMIDGQDFNAIMLAVVIRSYKQILSSIPINAMSQLLNIRMSRGGLEMVELRIEMLLQLSNIEISDILRPQYIEMVNVIMKYEGFSPTEALWEYIMEVLPIETIFSLLDTEHIRDMSLLIVPEPLASILQLSCKSASVIIKAKANVWMKRIILFLEEKIKAITAAHRDRAVAYFENKLIHESPEADFFFEDWLSYLMDFETRKQIMICIFIASKAKQTRILRAEFMISVPLFLQTWQKINNKREEIANKKRRQCCVFNGSKEIKIQPLPIYDNITSLAIEAETGQSLYDFMRQM